MYICYNSGYIVSLSMVVFNSDQPENCGFQIIELLTTTLKAENTYFNAFILL